MNRPARLVVQARGHPLVRATHANTLELTCETDITARATCVVGIAEPGAFHALTGLRGPITLSLCAGGITERVRATANPAFDGGPRAVVRRSRHRSPETLAVSADRAAADLDRDLVAALADPATAVEVEVEAGGGDPREVAALLVVPGRSAAALAADPSARRDLQGASVLVAPHAAPDARDATAARATAARSTAALATAAGATAALAAAAGLPLVAGPEALEGVAQRLARGEAVALVCDLEHPGEAVSRTVREAAEAGVAVRAAGASAPAAALVAAGLPGAPHAVLTPARTAAARGRQLGAVATLEVAGVWEERLDALLPLLGDLAAWRPDAPARLLLDAGGPDEAHVGGTAVTVATTATDLAGASRRTAATPAVVVADLRHGGMPAALGPAARHLLTALLAAGVSGRTLAQALRQVPGVSRREAYDLVLALGGSTPEAP